MAESIFTTQTPTDNPNATSPPGISLYTLFTPAVNGTITHIRWFWPLTAPSAPGATVALFQRNTDGAGGPLLGTGSVWDTTNTGAWNTCPLTSPVAITAGTYYYAGVFTPDRFVSQLAVFTPGPIVNGNLTAPQDDLAIPRRNGRFNAVPPLTYPDNAANGNCYFVDVLFNADTPTVAPDSITLTTVLGEPAVSMTQVVEPDSITLPILLGSPSVSGAPTAGRLDLVPALFEKALECLCEGTAGNPGRPALCVPRVGTSVVFDMGQYIDLCCEGISYAMLGDMYISSSSFPEQDIVQQIRGRCAPPTWAVDIKLGIVRCISAGQENGEPPLETDQLLAARQNLYDAQSLRYASCCFRNWLAAQYGDLDDGMDVVIGRQVQGNPQGGCVERYVTLTVQFADIDCGCS